MEKKKLDPLKEMKVALASLLTRVDNYRQKCVTTGQPFGVCTVSPKRASIGPPSKDIQVELKKRATDYFQSTPAYGYYFKYWTPPILPISEGSRLSPTVDDYHMVFEYPQFDTGWELTTLARGILYCPSDREEGDCSDWFELQHEAIRLTPLLHQSLEDYKIIYHIDVQLEQDGLPEFENFICEYGTKDPHLPMPRSELESWKARNLNWRVRYHLLKHLFNSSSTLRDFYTIAREKAASSRNPMLKALLRAFAKSVEDQLILNTKLPEELKKDQLTRLRASKKRTTNNEKYLPKRPAVCISDIECGQLLYLLITTLLSSTGKNIILMESILFIWIAQHGAFSDLNLNIQDILSIKTHDIKPRALSIRTSKGDIFITSGLQKILATWIKILGGRRSGQLFQKLSDDNFEDLLGKHSTQLFGSNGKLLPKDFLEKVHTTHGARIPLDLRRKISQQETLIKFSPYRIKSQEIKNQIQKSFEKRRF